MRKPQQIIPKKLFVIDAKGNSQRVPIGVVRRQKLQARSDTAASKPKPKG